MTDDGFEMSELLESHPTTGETRESIITRVGLLVLTLCSDDIVCPHCNGTKNAYTHDPDCPVGEALALIKEEQS